MLKLDVAMRTDKGLVRESNEDAIGADPTAGLMVLADGMGGANAGEVASQMAVDLAMHYLVNERKAGDESQVREEIIKTLERINYSIIELARTQPHYRGMGTTLVIGLLKDDRMFHAHVGDSRLYLLREGELSCLTRDHTLIQELLNLGEFADLEEALAAGVPAHILSRAFGVDVSLGMDLDEVVCQDRDLFLMCSDGLTNKVSDPVIQDILQTQEKDLEARAEKLIEAACERGGDDNISVILATVTTNDE